MDTKLLTAFEQACKSAGAVLKTNQKALQEFAVLRERGEISGEDIAKLREVTTKINILSLDELTRDYKIKLTNVRGKIVYPKAMARLKEAENLYATVFAVPSTAEAKPMPIGFKVSNLMQAVRLLYLAKLTQDVHDDYNRAQEQGLVSNYDHVHQLISFGESGLANTAELVHMRRDELSDAKAEIARRRKAANEAKLPQEAAAETAAVPSAKPETVQLTAAPVNKTPEKQKQKKVKTKAQKPETSDTDLAGTVGEASFAILLRKAKLQQPNSPIAALIE